MDKTIILVIDRDNDFGEKAHVESPVIGIEACKAAASALAIADPEDSDSNALFAAINNYYRMAKERPYGSFDIALICGDKDVGYRSDNRVVKDLETVIEKTKPQRAIIIGDGAEDESVIPIVSSRLDIDGVQRVIVKQAPGVESFIYILSRYLKDSEKRRRFGTPISLAVLAISIVFMFSNLVAYSFTKEFITNSTTYFILFILGLLMLAYAYSFGYYLETKLKNFRAGLRDGTTLLFSTVCILLAIIGVILGLYSLESVYTYRDSQKVVLFAANALWPFLFAFMAAYFGNFVSYYLAKRSLRYSSIMGCLYIVAAGLVATGALDLLLEYTGVNNIGYLFGEIEIISGIMFFVISVVIRARLRNFATRKPAE